MEEIAEAVGMPERKVKL
ncbi:MAG: hypothetical protein SNJ61_11520, partial [Fimbriimonadaceae bacterium]